MSYTLTVLDGHQGIGGTKLLVAGGCSSVLLDFGMNFSMRRRFYDEFLGPRTTRGVHDLVSLGLLPDHLDWYRPDLVLTRPDTTPEDQRRPDAVLLTHAHHDHAAYVSFLRLDVRVVSTLPTAVILKAMQDTSSTNMEAEVAYAIPREVTDGGLLRAGHFRTSPALGRRFQVLADDATPSRLAAVSEFWHQGMGSRELEAVPLDVVDGSNSTTWDFQVGEFRARAFAVDHSIPGACAFALETPAGWLAYTGDLRLHGRKGHLTGKFIDWLASTDVALLIVEGTDVDVQWPSSEAAVYENALQAARWTGGIVVADFEPRNVERLQTFLQVARDTQRHLVLTPRDAQLLHALHGVDTDCPDPLMTDEIMVYHGQRVARSTWERSLLERLAAGSPGGQLVSTDDIGSDPQAFMLAFGYYDLNELLDLPTQGGSYVYSAAEAHDEERSYDLLRLARWVQHLALRPVGLPESTSRRSRSRNELSNSLHVSGHMHGPGLLDLVERACPRKLVPIHTERRAFFKNNAPRGTRVVYPRRGEPIDIC